MSGRDEAIKSLRKSHANAFDYKTTIESLSTGSLAVDIITGIGGFPVGRISEVFGWEYSGKTTLCLSACAAAQQAGYYPVYIDIERGVDPDLALRIGFDHTDPDKGLLVIPDTFEQTMAIVEKLVESGEVPLIVVDSIPAMTPKSVWEGTLNDTTPIGLTARLLSTTLPRLAKMVESQCVALVLVNQMRKTITTGFTPGYMQRKEDTESSSGGSALKFYSSMRIDMKILKRGDEKVETTDMFTGKPIEISVANLHEAHIIKNKCAAPYRKASFQIHYGDGRAGIDHLYTVVGIGLSTGLIIKKGAHYSMYDGDTLLFTSNGEAALIKHLMDTPEMAARLTEQVLENPAIAEVLAKQARP